MSIVDNKNLNPELVKDVDPDLQPTQKRIMGPLSYAASVMGGCVSIGTLSMGAGLIGALTVTQAILAMTIGCLVIAIALAIIGECGHTYGIPFTVQLRSSFGTTGVKIPGVLRGLPAIVWYGFQTWLGGAALNNISIVFFGFDNIWVFFIAFQLIQVLLSIKGFQGAKWVGNIGGVVISIAMIYLLYICISQYGDVIGDKLMSHGGTWGMPFIGAVIAFFGNSTTVMLNAGDYSREVKAGYSSVARGASYFCAMVPATVLLGLIGAMASTATGIANPINAFAQMVDNKIVLLVTLGFIIFAQLSTNLASNVIPPAYAFMDVFKIKHRTAVIIVGILAVATCPWILTNDSSAAGLDLFVKIYSAFFAPIFAVLITDFFVLHKRNVTEEVLNDLYNDNGNHAGINWAAIIAIAVGAVIGLINVNVSFFTATIPTGLVFYFLMKKMPSCERFRRGTTLE